MRAAGVWSWLWLVVAGGVARAHGGEVHEATLSWADWRLDPGVVLGLALAGVAFWWAGRSFGVARWRRIAFWTGLGVVFVALESPLDRGGDHFLFTLHMVQHSLLMMAAAPLLALGTPRPAVAWLGQRLPGAGGVLRWLSGGVAVTALFNINLAVWHLPAFYEAALRNEAVHITQHLLFLGLGYGLWLVITAPEGDALGPRLPLRLALVVVSVIVDWLVSFSIAVAGRPLYPTYAAAPRLWGLSPEADQALGGGLMWVMDNMVYGAVTIWLVYQYLRQERQRTAGRRSRTASQPVGNPMRTA